MADQLAVGGTIPNSLTTAGGYDFLRNQGLALRNKYMGGLINQQQGSLYNMKPFSGLGGGQNSLSYTPSWNGNTPGLNQSMGLTGQSTTTDVNNVANFGLNDFNSSGNSMLGNLSVGGIMDIGTGLMNAYNIYNQNKFQSEYLDMAKEQLGMAKEQWAMTKDEVSRIAKVRNNLNAGYQHGNYAPSPESKTYA